jgi:hypothetical protein
MSHACQLHEHQPDKYQPIHFYTLDADSAQNTVIPTNVDTRTTPAQMSGASENWDGVM